MSTDTHPTQKRNPEADEISLEDLEAAAEVYDKVCTEDGLPPAVPREFIEDCIYFTQMFCHGGVACAVHGEEHQEEMRKRWPVAWMQWLFDTVGEFGDAAPTNINSEDELEMFWDRMEPGARVKHWDLVEGLCLDPHVCQRFMQEKVEAGLARPAGVPGNYIVIGVENE